MLKGNNDTTSPVTEAEETRCMMARISWRDRYKKRQAIVITVRINGLPATHSDHIGDIVCCRSSVHVACRAALVVNGKHHSKILTLMQPELQLILFFSAIHYDCSDTYNVYLVVRIKIASVRKTWLL